MRRKKNMVIIAMCIAMLFMGIGYAALSKNLKINSSMSLAQTWKVEFSDIRTSTTLGGATNKTKPSVTATTATFNVDLVQPGDLVEYQIDITNYGTLDAEIRGATYTYSGSSAVYVRVTGIQKGTVISNCKNLTTCPKVTMTIEVGYDLKTEKDPTEKTKTIQIVLDIGQYISSNPVTGAGDDLIPELDQYRYNIVQSILNDNRYSIATDTSERFGVLPTKASLFYTSTGTEGNKATYYFRGPVENNYVKFGQYKQNYTVYRGYNKSESTYRDFATSGECTTDKTYYNGCELTNVYTTGVPLIWRIVRINEDGSVRLILETKTGYTRYNNRTTNESDNALVGYMYGTVSASSYSAAHTNTNNSAVKSLIDRWYDTTDLSTTGLIADAGFCNDRSLVSGSGYSNMTAHYGFYKRVDYNTYDNSTPQFRCNQANDLFTTASASKGNKALSKPVGLLSADEVLYSGVSLDDSNRVDTYSYLYTGGPTWTMTPHYSNSSLLTKVIGYQDSWLASYYAASSVNHIRPVINIKGSALVKSGDGGVSSPYEFQY